MEQNFNRRIETDLDLNGPIITITSQPSDATVNHGATQTFSVTATATFPGNTGADNEGTLTYQWYEYDDGDGFDTKLTDQTEGVTFSGTTTATLTLANIESPAQNGLQYYCVVGYDPADRYAHAEKGAGHPLNGSVTSNSATLTVNPYLIIVSQPSSIDREYNVDGNINIVATLSDSTYSNDIGYQWYRNDVPVSDGTYTTTRIERGTVIETITEENEVVTRHNYSFSQSYSGSGSTRTIPTTASNIVIEVSGGGGGKGGSDWPWKGGGDGGKGRRGKFDMSESKLRGTTLTMYAGKKGSDGIHGAGSGSRGAGGNHGGWAGGGNGGAAGGSGASGGGGGGGSAAGVYHGSLSTPIIVAGGGGGGGGESYGKEPETNSAGIGYAYVRQLLGVHDGGKTIAYGDSDGRDWNATLKITSGDAKFLSEHSIGGSGSVGLYYEWADNPRRAGRSNTEIYVGGKTITHTYNRSGNQSVTIDLGTGVGNKNAGQWENKSTIYADGGHGGHPCECSDGAGGGGGGAGAVSSPGAGAGVGGAGGCDSVKGGFSGAGGQSWFNGTYGSLYSNSAGTNSGNGYVSLSYDWYEDETTTEITYRDVEVEIENSIPQNITFSGTQGSTLTVKADYDTVENLKCVVSSPQSSNSPLTSNIVQFSSYSNIENKILNLEKVNWDNGTATALLSSMDLNNGEVVLNYDPGTSTDGTIIFTSFYTTQNIGVEIDLYGGKGSEWTQIPGYSGYYEEGGYHGSPGKGGYGRITGTLYANTEYIIAGMFGDIDCPYFYRKDQFLACVGQGGGASFQGLGGDGGGLDLPGGTGRGGSGGIGAEQSGATSEQPPLNGIFGSRFPIVQSNPYTILNQRLYDACERNGDGWRYDDERSGGIVKRYSRDINNNVNLGTRKIIMRDGTFINNTASIDRGFMDIEYSFIQTAAGRGYPLGTLYTWANATSYGGNGYQGGSSGYNGGGGGGGSGMLVDPVYSGDEDGKGRWLMEETSSGTWDGNSKVVIRLAD